MPIERLRINVSWLLALRWAAVAGQLLTILTVWIGFEAELPLMPLFAVVGTTAVTNILLGLWQTSVESYGGWQRWGRIGDGIVDAVITLDILLLTILLYFTGGASNPFSVFFLVNLALASVVVQTGWIWLLGTVSIIAFAMLTIWYQPLALLRSTDPAASFSGMVSVRTEGMIVAFAAATVAIAYFIARLQREIRTRDTELDAARQRESRNDKLEALATLAAGAAHELATPLSTIAVVARELERHLESSQATSESISDARLIRTELAHCRQILDRMAGRAGESVGEGMTEMNPVEVIEETLTGLPGTERVEIATAQWPNVPLLVPRVALGQALRGLVKNALDASGRDGKVMISCRPTALGLRICIEDNGPGMGPETLRRAGEPFFTTKQPGEGTGLGLFLARAVIERLGGALELRSTPGRGTTAEILLPRSTPR